MDKSFFSGIVPPIAVPIDSEERLDEARLRKHIDFMTDGGVSGILAFGSNGEFYMQDEDEQEEILSVIMDQVNGRVPVYMGIGEIRTKKCIKLAHMGMKHGAKAISIL